MLNSPYYNGQIMYCTPPIENAPQMEMNAPHLRNSIKPAHYTHNTQIQTEAYYEECICD